jgi:hypothetical protein
VNAAFRAKSIRVLGEMRRRFKDTSLVKEVVNRKHGKEEPSLEESVNRIMKGEKNAPKENGKNGLSGVLISVETNIEIAIHKISPNFKITGNGKMEETERIMHKITDNAGEKKEDEKELARNETEDRPMTNMYTVPFKQD